jgi:hypothetical protein
MNWVSYFDVARVAVDACVAARPMKAVLPLGGPDAMSPLEVVRLFERRGVPSPRLNTVEESALEGQCRSPDNSLSEAFAALMLIQARGQLVDSSRSLEQFPGRLRTLEEYVELVTKPAT